MAWVPSAIAAGASIVGSLMDRDSASEQISRNEALQREFAQMGIRWRVADAKAAGLHPLYALGGSGATYSPSPIVSGEFSQMGQALGRAIQGQQTATERQVEQGQLKLLEAQAEKEYAMAQYYSSEAARSRQASLVSSSIPSSAVGPTAPASSAGRIKVQPDQVITSRVDDPSLSAGLGPFWKSYQLGDGTVIDLPISDEGPHEAAENPTLWPAIAVRNIERYGARWIGDVTVGRKRMDSVTGAGADFIEWLRSFKGPTIPKWTRERELEEAVSGRHEYPAGRYYDPRMIGNSWDRQRSRYQRRR